VTSIFPNNSVAVRVIEKFTIEHQYKLGVACLNAYIVIDYNRHLAVKTNHVTSILLHDSATVREKFTLENDYKRGVTCLNAYIVIDYNRHLAAKIDHVTYVS